MSESGRALWEMTLIQIPIENLSRRHQTMTDFFECNSFLSVNAVISNGFYIYVYIFDGDFQMFSIIMLVTIKRYNLLHFQISIWIFHNSLQLRYFAPELLLLVICVWAFVCVCVCGWMEIIFRMSMLIFDYLIV